jgi:hypothetical protein
MTAGNEKMTAGNEVMVAANGVMTTGGDEKIAPCKKNMVRRYMKFEKYFV